MDAQVDARQADYDGKKDRSGSQWPSAGWRSQNQDRCQEGGHAIGGMAAWKGQALREPIHPKIGPRPANPGLQRVHQHSLDQYAENQQQGWSGGSAQ